MRTHQTDAHTAAETSGTVRRCLALAGILAPVVFTVSVFAQSFARDDHNLLRDPGSHLAAGTAGWVQDLTFFVTGILLIAFGLGLHLALRPRRHIDPGPQFLALAGLALVGAAVWPAVDASGAATMDRVPHNIAGLITFASAGLSALALRTRLARDPRWSDLARYVGAVGAVLILLFLAGAVAVRPPGAPLHDWIGLFQWVFLGTWFPLTVVLAVRLHRLPAVNAGPHG